MITTSRLLLRAGLSTAIAASMAVSELAAQEVKLPAALTFTAYDTGTSGFNIAVGVGKGLRRSSTSSYACSRPGMMWRALPH